MVQVDPVDKKRGLREKWNEIYRDRPDHVHYAPAEVLTRYAHLLPRRGAALDLACGLGANALFLAQRGLETSAFDISEVAIEHLRAEAERRGMIIHAEVRDVEAEPLVRERFDVIVVCRFLARQLAQVIAGALRPGGLLFYQTFTREKIEDSGPSNPAYLLGENELLDLFRCLRVIAYREEGLLGDHASGLRNQAYLVGQRRPQTLAAENELCRKSSP